MLSAHQPAFLPWLGLLDKIRRADTFVILDDVQYATGRDNYVNRNRIKGPGGAEWLTLALDMRGHLGKSIADMEVLSGWRDKHLARIRDRYAGAQYVDISGTLLPPHSRTLADVAGMSLTMLVDMLMPECLAKLQTQSELKVTGHKTELIVNLCRATNERSFLFGGCGRDYADLDMLRDCGIEPVFQEYVTPEYPQQWGPFVPNLSAIDAVLNIGPEATRRLLWQ